MLKNQRKSGKGGGEVGADGTPAPPPKPKEITFLEGKDSKTLGIALSKFKQLPGFKEGARFRVVRDALDALDEDKLMGQDGLEILEKMLPLPEWLEAAKKFDEDSVPKLAFAENYVWELSKVKLLPQRVKCMRLTSTLSENMALVEKDLTCFSAAASEILDSPRLIEFLVDVVRPFGNELNRAGGKKDAIGIKISGLVKLGATRTADNSMTSLFYIVSVLVKHRPALLDICHEFNQCKTAMRLSLSGLEGNFKAVKEAAVLAESAMRAATSAKDELFIAKMGPMAAKVAGAVGALEERLVTLKANLIRAAEYLGEKERDQTKPEGLFGEWFGFIDLLSKTYGEFRDKREKEAKKAREEAAKIKVAEEKAAKAAAKAAKTAESGGGGESGSSISASKTGQRGGGKKIQETPPSPPPPPPPPPSVPEMAVDVVSVPDMAVDVVVPAPEIMPVDDAVVTSSELPSTHEQQKEEEKVSEVSSVMAQVLSHHGAVEAEAVIGDIVT